MVSTLEGIHLVLYDNMVRESGENVGPQYLHKTWRGVRDIFTPARGPVIKNDIK